MISSLLVFTSYYLPGFKAGGPIRSISSLVENLNSNFEISIVTRNHDIGDNHAYNSLHSNFWYNVNKSRCMYLSYFSFLPMIVLLSRIRVSSFKHIYFNSFFDFKFSLLPLFYLRIINFLGFTTSNIIIAPRGEFALSALNSNKFLKRVVIFLFKFFSADKFVTWHATSIKEEENIIAIFGNSVNIVCLENFPSSSPLHFNEILLSNKSSILKIIFVGRVSPMKNLHIALNILKNVKSIVIFDVYGPLEDFDYYNQCVLIVNELPNNIKVNFLGELKHDNVRPVLLKYDLFFSPTLGENYGHAIVEAFLVGCPVLISDNTPWRELKLKNAGFDISLDHLDDFSFAIDFFANMDADSFNQFKLGSYNYGLEISNFSNLKNGYLILFN